MADDLQRLLLQSSQQLAQGGGDDAHTMMQGGNQQQTVPGGSASLAEKLVFLAENERQAPEILPYPTELLAQLQSEMAQRRDEIDTMRQQSHTKTAQGSSEDTDALLGIVSHRHDTNNNNNNNNSNSKINPNSAVQISTSSTLPFRVEDLLALEMTRLKYAVADLIRVRLQKIQFFRDAILEEPEKYRDILSENELLLVQSMSEIFNKAMIQGGLGQLPVEYRNEPSSALPKPNLSTYVLAIVLETSEIHLRGQNEPRVMETGTSVICSYESVRRYLVEGRVRLM